MEDSTASLHIGTIEMDKKEENMMGKREDRCKEGSSNRERQIKVSDSVDMLKQVNDKLQFITNELAEV